jgi:cysteine synthase A
VDWEIYPKTALEMLEGDESIILLDLRDGDDFDESHYPGAMNLDIGARGSPNPYKDSQTMIRQFRALDKRLSADDVEFGETLVGRTVITLSYKGHVGRLANSILRNRGIKAHCVIGGSESWEEGGLWDKDGSWGERIESQRGYSCCIM